MSTVLIVQPEAYSRPIKRPRQMCISGGTNYKSTDSRSTSGGHETGVQQ